MKKVIKDFDKIPKRLQNCETKIEQALLEKGAHNFSSNYYGHEDVKAKLLYIYKSTCAFCETDTTAGAPLQVEHYRPKAKVTNDITHSGYYWLGYEWSNLLYSCSICNRAKSTHFPLEDAGVRANVPPIIEGKLDKKRCRANSSELVAEKPMIINPEEEDYNPFDHFFLAPKGKILGKSKRGDKSITILKLYRRPLVIARKKVVDTHLKEFIKHFSRLKDKEIGELELKYAVRVEIEKILDRIINNDEYSTLAKSMLKHFDIFFVRRFQPKEGEMLLNIFIETIRINKF